MPITVNFKSLGESATYPDGTTEDVIHDDYQRRQFRGGYKANPIQSIMGLMEHITSRPTAPTPASVDGASVIGLAPDQTTALLDRVQRTNEVEQNAYQQEIARAAQVKEAQAQRQFSMQSQQQDQQFQLDRDKEQDAKTTKEKLEGTVKPDGQGGYDWVRPDPVTGKPLIDKLQKGSNQWKSLNMPDGGVSQVEMDPSGRMLGTPQTVIAGQKDTTNWQQVGSPYQTADGQFVQNLINPETRQMETKALPMPAAKPQALKMVKDTAGNLFAQYTDPTTGAVTLRKAEVPPEWVTEQAKKDGINLDDFNSEWDATVMEEFDGVIEAEDVPAVTERVQARLLAKQTAVNSMNTPAEVIFVGKDGKRYLDLGDGTAEEL
jgi:hypothetical protein